MKHALNSWHPGRVETLRWCSLIAWAAVALAAVSASRADVVLYAIPKIQPSPVVMLQGQAKALAGGTISFRHPRFTDARLILDINDARIYHTLSPQALFDREMRKAAAKKDAKGVMDAAMWGLDHGLLDKFYEGAAKTLEIDPQNARALRLGDLKRKIDQPVKVSPSHEAYMRRQVPLGSMRFETSDHFLLMCDTPTKPGPHHRLPRAEERLELLELVYKSFLYRFVAYDAKLEVPTEPLLVVLFNNEADFREYSTKLSPELASAAGFWDSDTNISYFYDHGTSPEYQAIGALSNSLKQKKEQYIRNKNLYAPGEVAKFARMADTLELLFVIAQENSDIEVVSHEITHQMAGNTGLLPRHVMVPTWVHEGLATYFEAPKDATWSGIGAVNETRLEWYRGLERDRQHSNIDFIVGDQIFTAAASHGATLHAYGQAWGLTHFLMNKRPDDLMKFYRRLGQVPPDLMLSAEASQKLFSEVFGANRSSLDLQWRSYMRSLKDDVQVFIDKAAR